MLNFLRMISALGGPLALKSAIEKMNFYYHIN